MVADDSREIVLRNGETLRGQILLLAGASFLVQTEDLCLMLSEEDVRSVDGQEDLRRALRASHGAVCRADYFHDVHEDGGGTDWIRSCEVYDGRVTLFWEPRLITDSNGEAKLEFYTSDRQTTYDVYVNGIMTESGHPGQGHAQINSQSGN